MVFSENLKYLMLEFGISPKELSMATNIDKSTLTKLLNSSTAKPREATVYALAKYFKIKPEDLFDNSYLSEFKPIQTNNKLADILKKLLDANGIETISLLSQCTDISVSILSDIINGKTTNPQVKTLHKLASFFNVTVYQITGQDKIFDYKRDAIIHLSRTLPCLHIEQIKSWLGGKLKTPVTYDLKTPKTNLEKQSYVIKINTTRFYPEFTQNHILIVNSKPEFTANDFVVLEINNVVSIFQCINITNISVSLREAGSCNKLVIDLEQASVLGKIDSKDYQ